MKLLILPSISAIVVCILYISKEDQLSDLIRRESPFIINDKFVGVLSLETDDVEREKLNDHSEIVDVGEIISTSMHRDLLLN